MTVGNNSSHQEFCSGSESWSSNETSPGTDCDDEMLQTAVYRSAFHLFILARLLHGFGYSGIQVLGMTYIEENSQKTKSTLYIGVMTSTLAFGSLCGFLLASFMLRMPENLSSEVLAALRPDDAKWIGCWWLGYLLISICFLFASIPLWFFPSSMAPRKPILSRKTNTCRQSSIAVRIWKQITEFLSYVSHIFRNSSYVINAGFKVCESFVTFGLIIAASRYIEIAFYQHAYMASIISALSCSLPTALGGFAGGLIMSRLRTKPPGMVRLMIISTTISMIGVGFVLFLRCPRLNIAGRIHSDSNRFTVGTECSNQCACSVDRKSSYNPVCGSDNFTYFSACIAGCTDVVNGTFVGCQCIGAAVDNSSTKLMRSMDDWTARPGLCLPKCWIVALFGIVIFPSVFMFAVARAPTTVINFRVVDGDKRSFALAFNSFISQLVGAIPGPMLFGALIDSTCLLWQTDSASQSACKDSSSSTGSCLLFDTDLFRWRTYGVTFGVQLLQVLLAVLLYCVIRRRHFDDMDVICQKTVDVPAAPATQKQSCDSALTDEYLELCQKH